MVLGVRCSTNNKAQEIKNVYIVAGIAEIKTFNDGRQELKISIIFLIARRQNSLSTALDVLHNILVVAGMLWRGSVTPACQNK